MLYPPVCRWRLHSRWWTTRFSLSPASSSSCSSCAASTSASSLHPCILPVTSCIFSGFLGLWIVLVFIGLKIELRSRGGIYDVAFATTIDKQFNKTEAAIFPLAGYGSWGLTFNSDQFLSCTFQQRLSIGAVGQTHSLSTYRLTG